jgi:hypothetical protein
MLVFVDESGDCGLKILNGSSTHFIVAAVTFEDLDEADDCDKRIDLLRQELHLPPNYEFHFSANSKKVRQAFLSAVSPYLFFYHIFALNKDPQKLWGPGFGHKDSLYKYAAGLTFENAKPWLDDAIVVIDQSGDQRFQMELARYLRRRIRDDEGRRLIKKVKQKRSAGNNLLQLADYVAGVCNRYISEKVDGIEMRRKYLATHEMSLQIWPK